MEFQKRSKRDFLQFLAVCGLPALALTPWIVSNERTQDPLLPFNDTVLKRLRKKRPEMVILGNSMVYLRLDLKYLFQQVSPLTMINITVGGTRSLQWFLWLKNYVADTWPAPKLVFIPYRDYDFTNVGQHIEGPLLDTIRESMRPGDESYLHLARGEAAQETLKSVLYDHLSLDETNKHVRKKINDTAYDTAALVGPNTDAGLKAKVDAEFGMENLRSDIADADAIANDSLDPLKARFTADPEKNLLSKFVEVAAEQNFKIVFYRVKRRPNEENVTVQDANLKAYTADFKKWIEANGHHHIDETEDPRITLKMFRDGDHLHADAFRENTDLFLERVRHLFPAKFSDAELEAGQKVETEMKKKRKSAKA